MADTIAPSDVVGEFGRSRLKTYMRVAPAALLIYEYFLILGSEVSLVWPSRTSPMKILYFATRYLVFVDVVVPLYYQLKPGLNVRQCKTLYVVDSWLIVLGIIIAEAILMVRTWAIWDRGKHMFIFLTMLSTVAVVAACVVEGLFLKTLTFATYADPALPGCVLTGGNTTVGLCFVIIIVVETIVLILTLIRGIQRFRLAGAQAQGLMFVLYRDGILFYIYLVGISILNFVIILTLPAYGADVLTGLQRVLHSCISARVLINLRKASATRLHNSISLSTPVFAVRTATTETMDQHPY